MATKIQPQRKRKWCGKRARCLFVCLLLLLLLFVIVACLAFQSRAACEPKMVVYYYLLLHRGVEILRAVTCMIKKGRWLVGLIPLSEIRIYTVRFSFRFRWELMCGMWFMEWDRIGSSLGLCDVNNSAIIVPACVLEIARRLSTSRYQSVGI